MARPAADIYAETLAVFDRGEDPFEPLTTIEVADALDANRRTVYKRLEKLEARGELETKDVGSRARVWWRQPDPDRNEAGSSDRNGVDDRSSERDRVDGRPDPLTDELERYRAIVEAMGDPVYALDTEGRLSFVNQALLDRTGFEKSEVLGEHVSIAMDEETVERIRPLLLERLEEDPDRGLTVEFELTAKDGERYPVENNISLLTDDDGRFRGSAGSLRDISERLERERDLERQREQLAALNNLHDVVRDITEAVIDQSNRQEIERTVCERLAAVDSYEFAWIAEVDRKTEEVVPRVEVGVEGYLESVELSTDPDERIGQGPAGRTFRTGEMQVSRDVFEDTAFEPWRETAERYGYRSVATIPIVYEGTLYGAIGVYSSRVDAFADEEREVVGQLGEVVGHAIAATEQKQALLADEVTEIGFRLRDYLDMRGVSLRTEGRIDLDQPVAIGDGAFLVYGTATGNAFDTVEALVEAETAACWESVSVLRDDGDEVQFSVRLIDSPLVSGVSSHGGCIRQASVEDGDIFLRIHFPTSTNVSRVVDRLVDSYPEAEMLTRRQRSRPERSALQVTEALGKRLTERQQAALEAGYFAGFFEWPRDSSGEDVASLLGISPSTFHQHVRKAEKELLDAIFDGFDV